MIIDPRGEVHNAYWEYNAINLPYSGIPFYVVGRKFLDCHLGRDLQEREKLKRAAKKEEKRVRSIMETMWIL